jgi:hypothetical protein
MDYQTVACFCNWLRQPSPFVVTTVVLPGWGANRGPYLVVGGIIGPLSSRESEVLLQQYGVVSGAGSQGRGHSHA